ncbi:hypothetical protein CTZ27_35585 [Streptomyces griseocarneus]|nr:hypothetical protein CTZ27_35585 [Streptomyces griseocarneus]
MGRMPPDQLNRDGTPDSPDLPPDESAWWQLYLQFADWTTADQMAADHLAPLLNGVDTDGATTRWWFMRKHPCWRLRLHVVPHDDSLKDRVAADLDELAAAGHIHRWWTGIYEPETAAFGNTGSMQTAHELFHADSRAILDLHRHGTLPIGRRELSILLCSTLMRAAATEWYEQGDVWHRVAQERPLPDDVPQDRLQEFAADLRHLMLADTQLDGPLMGGDGPLVFAASWSNAFREAGTTLGNAARTGALDRGLREVLAYHVIFHWNRLGLSTRKQNILAWAARTAILGLPHQRASTPRRTRTNGSVPEAADRIAVRFPLVSRPRLTCPELKTRIAKARKFAYQSEQQANSEARVERACAAWNLAALIAADCGMSGLAADLCWRQFKIFRGAWPVAGKTAVASLQPLVNLARLSNRTGDPEAAYQALDAMNHAVHHGGTARVHGRTISFDSFTVTSEDRQEAGLWLRALLLEDGTRLLTAAGEWARAAAHAANCDDSVDRLGDARQVRVISNLHKGKVDEALNILEASEITETWEHAAAACLRSYIDLRAGRLTTDGVATMLEAVRRARQPQDPAMTFFRFRVGLTAVDLAGGKCPEQIGALCAELIRDTITARDAFTAREILSHGVIRERTTPVQDQLLRTLISKAGLGRGTIAPLLLADLMGTVEIAEACLAQALGVPSG